MFTQNQTRQFYVVKAVQTSAEDLVNPGDIMFNGIFGTPDFYFSYVSTDGKIQRSDMIDGGLNTSVSAKFTAAAYQARQTKASVVTLDNSLLNDGKIINGQDYMLNIRIQQYYFKSDLIDTWKHGIVHGVQNMSASDFYVKMAYSLALNFSREPWPILKFYIGKDEFNEGGLGNKDEFNEGGLGNDELDSTKLTEITKDTDISSLLGKTGDDAYVAIVIDEAEQDWHLGKMEQEPVIYDAHCDYIVFSGEQSLWGNVVKMPGLETVGNGRMMADMEWFYHGERGDIYRDYAYPANFDFVGLVDPTKTYDSFDIHYYWQGANHAIQKSEKDITLVVDRTLTTAVAAIKSALGIS